MLLADLEHSPAAPSPGAGRGAMDPVDGQTAPMTDLFWPGDERAGDLMSEAKLLDAMVGVKAAWLDALVDVGLAPASGDSNLTAVVSADDGIAGDLVAGAVARARTFLEENA